MNARVWAVSLLISVGLLACAENEKPIPNAAEVVNAVKAADRWARNVPKEPSAAARGLWWHAVSLLHRGETRAAQSVFDKILVEDPTSRHAERLQAEGAGPGSWAAAAAIFAVTLSPIFVAKLRAEEKNSEN